MTGILWRRVGASVTIVALVSAIGIAVGAADANPSAPDGVGSAHRDASRETPTRKPTKAVLRAALPAGAIQHILVIELENEGEQTTYGPSSPATYLNNVLRKQGELLVHYYATGHVSLDNYIAQVSGQAPNDATGADCTTPVSGSSALVADFVNVMPGTPAKNQRLYPGQAVGTGCVYPKSVPTIGNQLDTLFPPNKQTGVASWRDYDEDMGNIPSRDGGVADSRGGTDCAHPAIGAPNLTNAAAAATSTTPADQYATRHNPFVFFHSIISNTKLCDANVVPLGTVQVGVPSNFDGVSLPDTFSGHLATDLGKISTTPRFGWITPNLCDDGHDSKCAGPNTDGMAGAGAGGLAGADAFLQHWVPLIEASPTYRAGHMLIVITFDEGAVGAEFDGSSCCGERAGPSDPTPYFSPFILANYEAAGYPPPTPGAGGGSGGGGVVGALLLSPKYVKPGSIDTTGYYNHYSALRSYEDLLGITKGGVDGYGHIGFAAAKGLTPFGPDVFNFDKARKKK